VAFRTKFDRKFRVEIRTISAEGGIIQW